MRHGRCGTKPSTGALRAGIQSIADLAEVSYLA